MLSSRIRSICLVIPFAVCLVLAESKPYKISAARKDTRGKWSRTEILEQTRDGVAFQIKYLEAEARRAALRSAIGRDIDLFPGRSGEDRPGYLAFVLQVNNESSQDVLFNPGQARLASEKGDMKFALDYSALYEIASRAAPEPPTLDEMASAIFDRVVTIKPGGSVRKLLAFEAPKDDRYRTLEVRLLEVNIGPSSVDLVFPFHKIFERE